MQHVEDGKSEEVTGTKPRRTLPEDWLSRAWRPAGSLSLGDRWIHTGEQGAAVSRAPRSTRWPSERWTTLGPDAEAPAV